MAVNVIPDEVNFCIDVRHPEEEIKQRLAAAVQARCEAIAQERGLAVSSEITSDSLPSRAVSEIATGSKRRQASANTESQMRKVFALTEKAYRLSHEKDRGFLDPFAQALLGEKMSYERGGDISAREWFVKALRFIDERRGDIVSIIQLFKP